MRVSPNIEVIKCQGTCREYHFLVCSYKGKDMCATNITLYFPFIKIADFSLADWNQPLCEYLSTVFWAVKRVWHLNKVRTSTTFCPRVSHTTHRICVKGTGSCCHGAHTAQEYRLNIRNCWGRWYEEERGCGVLWRVQGVCWQRLGCNQRRMEGGRCSVGRKRGGVSEKRERVKRGYGSQPRPGQAQSTQCKNANTPPPPPGLLPKKNGG